MPPLGSFKERTEGEVFQAGIFHSDSSLNLQHWHNSYLAFVSNDRVQVSKLPHKVGTEECKRNQETEPVLHKRVTPITPHEQQ